MLPDNQTILDDHEPIDGDSSQSADQIDDYSPSVSFHTNADSIDDFNSDFNCMASAASCNSFRIRSSDDITETYNHAMTIEKLEGTRMETQGNMNGWVGHDTTLLSTNNASILNYQTANGSLKMANSVTENMQLDINKNHNCELPSSHADQNGSAHFTMVQRVTLHKQCVITRNRTLPSHSSNGIPLENNHAQQIKPQVKSTQTSKPPCSQQPLAHKSELYEEPPYHIALMCYLSYVVLTVFGYLRDFMRKYGFEKNLAAVERNREGYPPLYKNFESFYTRNIYRRIRDCWNRPIVSVPGAYITLLDRYSNDYNWTFEYPGTTHEEINMGSYNYLGFAENSGPIHDQVLDTLKENAVGVCSVRSELGHSNEVQKLEHLMAQFLDVESCIVFGMGFATNATNISCLVKKGCLILSDELNHASLILGCRLSGATIRTFKHNDMNDLERKIRKNIIEGQPRTRRPWKKIIIIVEGVYSMEGTIINLPDLIRLKKRYKCYVYLDEAHSIGALGPHSRGVVDYYNCDPRDIDILMGTFTKSFGSAGGYIAGRKRLVDHLRANSFSSAYAVSMSPVISKQIYCVIEVLMGLDGTDQGAKRIAQLARNTRYFRRKLSQLGFIVYGNDDSPVVPLMLCFCPKIAAVIRLAREKRLGFIGAGFPATSLTTGRVRFCISASHTKEILDRSLEVMNEIGDKIGIKYSALPRETCDINYDEV